MTKEIVVRNADSWVPTKFVVSAGKLRASRSVAEVALTSRAVVDIVAEALSQAIPHHCRGRLLDLGCGKSPLYGSYQRHVSEVTCADWPNSLHASPHLDVACDITTDLPFAADAFDTVLLTDVLEHVPTPERLLGEIHRVLAPGGTLLGTVPFMYWIHEEPHDHYRYTEYALRRMAGLAGLQVQRLEPYGGGLDVAFDVLGKTLVEWHWRIGPPLASLMQVLAGWARRGAIGRATRKRWQQLPLGYLFVLTKAALKPAAL